MTSNTPRIDLLERNVVINGNFDIWQRGISFPVTSSAYTADRFRVDNSAGNTLTVVRNTTDAPTVAQSGFQSTYTYQMTNGTAVPTLPANGYQSTIYFVEGFDYASMYGRKWRMQFWVKSSVAGTYSVCVKNFAADRSYVTTYALTSGVWTKIILDIPADTSGTQAFDSNRGLTIAIQLSQNFPSSTTSNLNVWQNGNWSFASSQVNWTATAGATFQLSQFMIIPQDYSLTTTVEVPFQRCGRSIGDELQLCQRYFEKSYDAGVAPGTIDMNGSERFRTKGTNHIQMVLFKVPKRATPSPVVFYNPFALNSVGSWRDLTNATNRTVATTELGDRAMGVSVSASVDDSSTSGHWTADAEL